MYDRYFNCMQSHNVISVQNNNTNIVQVIVYISGVCFIQVFSCLGCGYIMQISLCRFECYLILSSMHIITCTQYIPYSQVRTLKVFNIEGVLYSVFVTISEK